MHGTVERDGCAPWHGTFANVTVVYNSLTHTISYFKYITIQSKSVRKFSATYHIVVFHSDTISRADNSNMYEVCFNRH